MPGAAVESRMRRALARETLNLSAYLVGCNFARAGAAVESMMSSEFWFGNFRLVGQRSGNRAGGEAVLLSRRCLIAAGEVRRSALYRCVSFWFLVLPGRPIAASIALLTMVVFRVSHRTDGFPANQDFWFARRPLAVYWDKPYVQCLSWCRQCQYDKGMPPSKNAMSTSRSPHGYGAAVRGWAVLMAGFGFCWQYSVFLFRKYFIWIVDPSCFF